MSMKTNLHGRLRNTPLPASQGLMPLFEAVVNSIHSIEELAKDTSINIRDKNIKVEIIRDPQTNIDFSDKEHKRGPVAHNDIIGFKIVDEGIGFNDVNLQSFETLDSEHKIDKGCRGVGRLLWLKVFKNVEIVSYFKRGKDVIKRVFTFSAQMGTSEPSDEKVDLSIDDIKYKPDELAPEFCKDSLVVVVEYQLLNKNWSCNWQGKEYSLIKIINISKK